MTTHNTQRAYESDLRHFRAWGGTIPATALMVADTIAPLVRGLKEEAV